MESQISQLHHLRLKIAAYSQTLSERALTGRTLLLELETELRTKGTLKTEAEKLAKADPRYLDHTRRSIQVEYDKAVAEAEAEALALRIAYATADLKRAA